MMTGDRENGEAAGARWHQVLRQHLAEVPAFRALIRTIECRLFAEAGALDAPMLDVGCGDGLFAALAFDTVVAAGIDADPARLAEARARGRHRIIVRSRAEHLPFSDGAFATVVANCVLEHVEGLDLALAEIARVLTPGGRLVFGVPGPSFTSFLAVSSAARRLGAGRLADAYGAWFHRHSVHHHVLDTATWTDRLATHGLIVERVRPYMSRNAHALFDLAHYLSVPRLIRFTITGRWVGRPDGPVNAWWLARLAPHIVANPSEGAYLFVEARRGVHGVSPSSFSPSGVSTAVS